MKGPWNMACADTSDTQCTSMIGNPGTVFVDIISGSDGSQTLYAMGAWPDKATYDGCGSTEGLDATALTSQGISSPTSYTTGGSVTDPFGGVMGDLVKGGMSYNASNETWGMTFDQLFNATSVGGTPGGSFTYSAPDTWCPASVGDMNSSDNRGCYLQALEQWMDSTASCAPRFNGTAWDAAWDNAVSDGSGVVTVQTQLGSSPQINDRYSLMGLEILGGTGIASENFHENWNEWDGTTTQTCYYSEEMTITFTPGSNSNSAVGRFARKEFNSCHDSEPQLHTFEVNFSR
jgi:hypothetical protein